MNDLVDFLLARIAEDETYVSAISEVLVNRAGLSWNVDPEPVEGPLPGTVVAVLDSSEAVAFMRGLPAATHIARWDPSRVLAECEVKRRIVELHHVATRTRPAWQVTEFICVICGWVGDRDPDGIGTTGCDTLCALALPYADHPDYQAAWRP